MKSIIQSHKEFSRNTTTSGSRFTQPFLQGDQGQISIELVGTSANNFFVITPPAKRVDTAKEPSDFINKLLGNGSIQQADLSKGRKWVAGAFFEGQPESLKTLRLKAGLSQAQLAEKIAMSQPNICEFESGKRKPSAETLSRLSEALGVTVDVVLKSLQLTDQK